MTFTAVVLACLNCQRDTADNVFKGIARGTHQNSTARLLHRTKLQERVLSGGRFLKLKIGFVDIKQNGVGRARLLDGQRKSRPWPSFKIEAVTPPFKALILVTTSARVSSSSISSDCTVVPSIT